MSLSSVETFELVVHVDGGLVCKHIIIQGLALFVIGANGHETPIVATALSCAETGTLALSIHYKCFKQLLVVFRSRESMFLPFFVELHTLDVRWVMQIGIGHCCNIGTV